MEFEAGMGKLLGSMGIHGRCEVRCWIPRVLFAEKVQEVCCSQPFDLH